MESLMPEVSTKEKLQLAALDFFSTKGYDATTVDEIAESIGMKGPIIYKYFANKEKLLYSLHSLSAGRYEKRMGIDEDSLVWIHNGTELKQFTLSQLQYTLNDEVVVKFRRMYAINQFRDDFQIKNITKHQFGDINQLFEKIFSDMKKNGALVDSVSDVDLKLLAIEYTSTITVLIQLCDRETDKKEETEKLIERHIDFFIGRYCK